MQHELCMMRNATLTTMKMALQLLAIGLAAAAFGCGGAKSSAMTTPDGGVAGRDAPLDGIVDGSTPDSGGGDLAGASDASLVTQQVPGVRHVLPRASGNRPITAERCPGGRIPSHGHRRLPRHRVRAGDVAHGRERVGVRAGVGYLSMHRSHGGQNSGLRGASWQSAERRALHHQPVRAGGARFQVRTDTATLCWWRLRAACSLWRSLHIGRRVPARRAVHAERVHQAGAWPVAGSAVHQCDPLRLPEHLSAGRHRRHDLSGVTQAG